MSKANTLFIGLNVHKETTDVAWVSDKSAEAGPCGFWLYRHLLRRGIECWGHSSPKLRAAGSNR